MAESQSLWQFLASSDKFAIPRGVLGAVVGASAGHYITSALFNSYNMYGPAIIGLCVGVSCALLSRTRSWVLCAICVVIGFAVTLYWQYNVVDNPPALAGYFQNMGTRRMIFLVVSTAIAGWAGFGREYTKNL